MSTLRVVEPENRIAAYRNLLLLELAKRYRDQISTVFSQNKIWASVPEWNVAPRYLSLGIRLRDSRDLRRAMSLTREIGHAVGLGDGSCEPPIEAILVGGLLVYRFVLPEFIHVRQKSVRLWSDVYLDNPNLGMGVGLGASNLPIYFEFTQEAPHALVCGTSGSGKTELIKTMLYQMLYNVAVPDLGVAICDPKSDFDMLRDEEHMIFQPACDFDEIHCLIDHFHNEYSRRLQQNLRNERKWVLVIDEADQERMLRNPLNNEWVNDIVLRGRSLNMNVLIGTHMPDVSSLGPLGGGLTNRWFGLTANARESGQLEGGLGLHKLAGRGDFYAVVGPNKQRIQVALTRASDWERLNYIDGVQSAKVARLVADTSHAYIGDVSRPAHRPKIEADPYAVGFYLYHGPDRVTQVAAQERLDLSRTAHEVNREFSRKVARALRALRRVS